MKRALSLLSALVLSLTLFACSNEGNSNESNRNKKVRKLSASCDLMLAVGIDAHGNEFELVANETEDYSGTTIEMGVIKNNEWSIPLTTDSPFIGPDGLLYSPYAFSNATGSIYDKEFAVFHYIGNGCFSFKDCIWNGNDGSSYRWENRQPKPVVQITEKEWVVDNDGKFLLYHDDDLYILDTNTMQISALVLKGNTNDDSYYCFPHSEGLFACISPYKNNVSGFYNLNGEKIIDLSKYVIKNDFLTHKNQKMVFQNGTCTFQISNDQGTDYYITIDKTGAVVNSRKS